MEAAERYGIDHRLIWLWAGQGKVQHVDVLEPGLNRPKTYYATDDLERMVALKRAGNTPEFPDGYPDAAAIVRALQKVGIDITGELSAMVIAEASA